MDKFRGTARLFFFWFIILSPRILTTVGDGGQKNDVVIKQEKPSLIEMITDAFSLLTRSHIASWDKVKSIINLVQMNFFPPNLDFRSAHEAQSRGGVGGDGVGGKMKEAVEKSFGSSKVTVEECAKSAAKIVGEVAHETAEKVKESVWDKQESDAEL